MQELIGIQFGKLKVIEVLELKQKGDRRRIICVCDCGNKKEFDWQDVRRGDSKSCGCLAIQSRLSHGLYGKRIYSVYRSMVRRCYEPTNIGFKRYGGRGITVCDEWLNDKKTFFDWAFKNGYNDSLQLDRRDNEKNYSPDNCRFVTPRTNVNNRSNTTFLTFENKQYAAGELCEKYNIGRGTLRTRIKSGWSVENALLKPCRELKIKQLK